MLLKVCSCSSSSSSIVVVVVSLYLLLVLFLLCDPKISQLILEEGHLLNI